MTIPRGWKEVNDGFGRYYAPSRDALWVFPDHRASFGEPQMFTVRITTYQNRPARALARAVYDRADREGRRPSLEETSVVGRPASVVQAVSRGCSACVSYDVAVQWDRETAIWLGLFSFGSEDFAERVSVFEGIYTSLREAPRDDHAGRVRAFLRARVAGAGAERFLSEAAEAKYTRWGNLYSSSNCGDIEWYRVLSVGRDPSLGTLYMVEAGDMEILQVGSPEEAPPSAIVRDVYEFRACGTS